MTRASGSAISAIDGAEVGIRLAHPANRLPRRRRPSVCGTPIGQSCGKTRVRPRGSRSTSRREGSPSSRSGGETRRASRNPGWRGILPAKPPGKHQSRASRPGLRWYQGLLPIREGFNGVIKESNESSGLHEVIKAAGLGKEWDAGEGTNPRDALGHPLTPGARQVNQTAVLFTAPVA